MKRLFVALVMLMVAVPVFAAYNIDNSSWNRLTERQKADIIKQVADEAERSKIVPTDVANPEQVGKWVGVGEQIGKMIGGAAKEVGVAVNEFVKTPVGMVAMGLIVWHYMGGSLVHIFGGLFLFLFGMSFIIWMARRAVTWTYTYDTAQKDIFGRSVLKEKRRSSLSNDEFGGLLFGSAAITAISLITVFTF